MERQLWNAIVQMINELNKPSLSGNFRFCIDQVLKVWFWAVVHDRPVSWATKRENWPIHFRQTRLPSDSTMSRRLRSRAVQEVLQLLRTASFGAQTFWPTCLGD